MRYVTSLILFFVSLSVNLAQDIKVLVDAPTTVSVGQQFQVKWTVNSRSGQFEAPEFTDFYKLMGPSTSYSQSTQIINGRVTSEIQNSYSFYLQATREGTFKINPAVYREKKKEYYSEPVTIKVVAGSSAQTQQQGGKTEETVGETQGGDELFARVLVNHKSVYIGEPLIASLKIYSRVNLSGIQEIKFPDFNGFLKMDLETPQLRSLDNENVGNRVYGTGVLQRFLIYPQKTGKLEIDPASLTLLVQQKTRSNDPFFGDFFSSFNTVPRAVATLPVEIEVKPLPGIKPESFSGVVGNITVKSSVNKDSLGVNDALNYIITLSGTGNLMIAAPPVLTLNPDIEIYEPKTSSKLKNTISGTTGSKSFEYVLIPRHGGEFDIPAVEISYFDPTTGTYKTGATSPHKIIVTGQVSGEESGQIFGAPGQEEVHFIGKDIRFVKSGSPAFRTIASDLISNISFLSLYLVLFIMFVIVIFLRREHVRRNADLNRVRNRKAASVARKRLKKASQMMDKGKEEEFYSELLKAIWGYLSDKLTIETSRLTWESSKSLLENMGIGKDIIDRLEKVINTCEYSQYSPDEDSQIIKETFDEISDVIGKIERFK